MNNAAHIEIVPTVSGSFRTCLVVEGRTVYQHNTGSEAWCRKVAAQLWPTLPVK